MPKQQEKKREEYVEVGKVEVRRVPDKQMFLREGQGSGEIGSGKLKRKFDLTSVIPGGSIIVAIKEEGHPLGGPQYIVQVQDAVQAAYDAYLKEKGHAE